MGHRPDWNDKDFKKTAARKFADGGIALTEPEMVAQEDAREMSTIKDVTPGTEGSAKELSAKDKKKLLRDALADSAPSGPSYGFASGLAQGLGRGARFGKD